MVIFASVENSTYKSANKTTTGRLKGQRQPHTKIGVDSKHMHEY